MQKTNFDRISKLSVADVIALKEAQKSYGNSWKKRGGIGAFMMLARKWDRIEQQVKVYDYDVFKTGMADPSDVGILDDIQDLRRYLLLVESQIREEVEANAGEATGAYVDQDR